jgi:hypothetical protein
MNRTLLILLIIGGVGIIGGLVGFLVNNVTTTEETTNTTETVINNDSATITEENSVTIDGVAPNALSGQTVATEIISDATLDEQTLLRQQSLTYAATYGSYSNQNNNEHLKTLLANTTSPLSDKFNNLISANDAQAPVGSYQGTTTVAVSAEIRSVTSTTATASVTTSRTETSDSQLEAREYTQSLTLIFKKLDGQWLVTEAEWGEETG